MFSSALNIVQLFTTLIVVIVVQHCSGPNLAKTGCLGPNFRSRAGSGGAQSKIEGSDPQIWRISEEAMSVNLTMSVPRQADFSLFRAKIAKLGSFGAPAGREGLIVQPKSLT